ncbi:MAG: hypothetical protein ABSE66_09395 [Thermoplasmata archaeon]|jgi:hypothetical protein
MPNKSKKRMKPRPACWPGESLNFRMWREGNKATVICEKCRGILLVLTGQAADVLSLMKEHRCRQK